MAHLPWSLPMGDRWTEFPLWSWSATYFFAHLSMVSVRPAVRPHFTGGLARHVYQCDALSRPDLCAPSQALGYMVQNVGENA